MDNGLFNQEPDRTIQARFEAFHITHPEVYEMFVRFATELVRAGRARYSSDAILHRVRWETDLKVIEGGFKINDHFSSRYARKLAAEHPSLFGDFFEFRKLKSA